MDVLDQDPTPARIDFTKVNTGLPQIEDFTDGGEEPISQTLTEHERHELAESGGLTAEQIDAATGAIISIAAERGRRALEAYFHRYVQGQDADELPYGLAREAFADEEAREQAFDHADEYLYDALGEVTTAYLGEV
jgi:hypothetical protein